MIEGNELAEIRPTGKTVSSEKLILRDTGLTTINKEINVKVKEGRISEFRQMFSSIIL